MTMDCPACAAPMDEGGGVCLACGCSPGTPAPAKVFKDARRDERFDLPTDVVLRKLGPGGVPEKEERTIAHDLSRSGMRILTSWSDLKEGDQVAVEEVGGNFWSGAIVRHVNRGADHITRVGIEFLEKRAPDRLVGTTTSLPRPVFNTVRSSPGPPAGASGPISLPASSRPISRPRNTGSIPRPRTTGSISRPRNSGSIPRPAVTRPPTSPVPPRGAGNQPPGQAAPVAAPRAIEIVLAEIATARTTARGLIAESKIWEALECLAKAQALAEGTAEAKAIRILTWETQAKIPSLMRAAQQNLEDLARSEPADVAVHSALGRIFWEAGLPARARVAFNRVLVLDPSDREATAALAVLSDSTKRG